MFELKLSLGHSSLEEILIQEEDEILAINMSPADEGDFGEESDGNQEYQEDKVGCSSGAILNSL